MREYNIGDLVKITEEWCGFEGKVGRVSKVGSDNYPDHIEIKFDSYVLVGGATFLEHNTRTNHIALLERFQRAYKGDVVNWGNIAFLVYGVNENGVWSSPLPKGHFVYHGQYEILECGNNHSVTR